MRVREGGHKFHLPTKVLSPRETEYMNALGRGERPEEIAERWGISKSTRNEIMENIKVKLGCGSVWQACIEFGRRNPRHVYF